MVEILPLITTVNFFLKYLIFVVAKPNFKKGIHTICGGFSAANFNRPPQMNFR